MKTKILFFACLLLFAGCKKYKAKVYHKSRLGILEISIHNHSSYPLTGLVAYALRGEPGNGEEPVNRVYINDVGVSETFTGELDFKSILHKGEYWVYMDYIQNGESKNLWLGRIDDFGESGFGKKGTDLSFYDNDSLVAFTIPF